MSNDTVYCIEPEPDGLKLIEIANYLRDQGFSLSYSAKDVLLMMEAKRLLKDKGARYILSQQLLTEETLPDRVPRALLLDTVMYKLDRCAPTASLLLIDPFIFPSSPDATYEADLLTVLTPSLRKIGAVRIATRANRDVSLEARIETAIRSVNASIRIEIKYTDIFHDRFWIADEARGIFLGTSFNGIGKRYALIDYLSKEDTQEIVGRYLAIP